MDKTLNKINYIYKLSNQWELNRTNEYMKFSFLSHWRVKNLMLSLSLLQMNINLIRE